MKPGPFKQRRGTTPRELITKNESEDCFDIGNIGKPFSLYNTKANVTSVVHYI